MPDKKSVIFDNAVMHPLDGRTASISKEESNVCQKCDSREFALSKMAADIEKHEQRICHLEIEINSKIQEIVCLTRISEEVRKSIDDYYCNIKKDKEKLYSVIDGNKLTIYDMREKIKSLEEINNSRENVILNVIKLLEEFDKK